MIPSGKPNEIWRIVRPIHLIRRLKKGILQESGENLKMSLLETENFRQNPAAEVPKGFLAVYVGPEMRRFVIPASYLCLPVFKGLMERVAEEFGFDQTGGLRIPCEEEAFEEILLCLEVHQKKKHKKTVTKVLYPRNHS